MNRESLVRRQGGLLWYERYMVRRFHPRRILLDAAGLPWVVYLLWWHNWPLALLVGLGTAALGAFATMGVDAERFSRTRLGRLALLHLHPANAPVQLVGLVVLVWALWVHSTVGILSALSVLFLGHLAGWEDVIGEEREQSLPARKRRGA